MSFDGNVYIYNANGIRICKAVDEGPHDYILDGVKILRETWEDNTLIPLYDNEDSVCGIIYNEEPFYFQKNLQGDVIAIVDKYGETVARYTYDAWGKVRVDFDDVRYRIASINPFRYRGYYYDMETELYYLQSRYYDPKTGRFINADDPKCLNTVAGSIGTDLFAYCENDSVNLSDMLGGFSWSIFPKIINFLTGVAGKMGEYLLKAYGISKKKYAHKLKYNNANTLTKFVNDNKKKLKKFTKGFSNVANCLEILAISSECYNRIKKYSGTSLLKTVASLAFYGVVSIIGVLVNKLVSWIISKLVLALFWARFIIELILEQLIDWILGRPWVSKLENKFVQLFNGNNANIGQYIVVLFKAAKAVFA